MSLAMLTVLLWYAFAAIGAVALITARLLNVPLGLVVWMPVGGWMVGYGAGCVTAYGIWQTWPGVRTATDEGVVFVTSALLGSLLGAVTGGALALTDFRRNEDTPSHPRRLVRVIMLAFVIVVVVMECAGCAGVYQWLSYAK